MKAVSDGEVEANQQESVDWGGHRAEVRDAQVCCGNGRDIDQNVHRAEREKIQSAIGGACSDRDAKPASGIDLHCYCRRVVFPNLPCNLAAMEQTNSCRLIARWRAGQKATEVDCISYCESIADLLKQFGGNRRHVLVGPSVCEA